MSTLLTTDELSRFIQQKHDVLVQLHELARRQLAVIASEDTDRLLALLAVKQPLLNELQRLERALDPYRDQDPQQRQWRQAADRRHCQVIAERAAQLLKELLLLERQAELETIARRDHTATQLQAAGHAMAAKQAYSTAASFPAASQLDLMSET